MPMPPSPSAPTSPDPQGGAPSHPPEDRALALRSRVLALRRQVQRDPGDGAALRELQAHYLDLERPVDAAVTGEALLALGDDDHVRLLVVLSWAQAGEPARALAHLRGRPLERELCVEIGTRCAHLSQWSAAAALFQRALELAPLDAVIRHSLAHSLDYLHDFEASEALRREALTLFPHPEAQALFRFGLAQSLLLRGRFREGLEAIEARFGLPGAPVRQVVPGTPWAGEPLQGRTLLLRWEQGFGDAFMAARYVAPLRAAGARVLLECVDAAAPVLATCPGLEPICTGDTIDLPLDTLQVWLLSLPLHCGTTLDTIPGGFPYLGVPPEVADRERLAAALAALPPGRRVGLVWEGSPAHIRDGERSLPAHLLHRLSTLEGVQWVKLQRSPRAMPDLPMLDLGDLDFAQVAFVLEHLDGLLTVDSAYGHLAGAMGRSVDLLLHHLPDWRWMLDRPDSPWYPRHRLWRQPAPGDWAGALDAWMAAQVP